MPPDSCCKAGNVLDIVSLPAAAVVVVVAAVVAAKHNFAAKAPTEPRLADMIGLMSTRMAGIAAVCLLTRERLMSSICQKISYSSFSNR